MLLHIVLVDDEPTILEGLEILITSASDDYRIIGRYTNGQEALAGIGLEETDVIVTDVKMPIMDGLTLIKEVRSRTSAISSIVLSGFNEFEFVREALRSEAADFLLKPVNTKELFSIFEKLLDMKRKSVVPESEEKKVIRMVKQIVTEEYCSELNLPGLSARVFLSPAHVSHLFKQETGITITDYLIQVRMDMAKLFIKQNPMMKLYELAQCVGYQDPDYFNQLFKKRVGKSVKQYRDTLC
ncbi:hypothetical protein A8709_14320 [Paenibacillus pectinilyticus]|uniref:DNA-binding response regulator n=1 Tax=Paenibacillus pectinilyticus TaxID=512399 RepID=A0A1C1A460_9BACL|nr:response regulator [Paenibacillus pectinilyticus]OCT15270.1 hypothetical protein A8709_14320 [Paenibacillus pectinilyticus]